MSYRTHCHGSVCLHGEGRKWGVRLLSGTPDEDPGYGENWVAFSRPLVGSHQSSVSSQRSQLTATVFHEVNKMLFPITSAVSLLIPSPEAGLMQKTFLLTTGSMCWRLQEIFLWI